MPHGGTHRQSERQGEQTKIIATSLELAWYKYSKF